MGSSEGARKNTEVRADAATETGLTVVEWVKENRSQCRLNLQIDKKNTDCFLILAQIQVEVLWFSFVAFLMFDVCFSGTLLFKV